MDAKRVAGTAAAGRDQRSQRRDTQPPAQPLPFLREPAEPGGFIIGTEEAAAES